MNNGLPFGINEIHVEDKKEAEQCFAKRGLFRDEDLLIEGWAYLIRDIKNNPIAPLPINQKKISSDLVSVHECFEHSTVKKIVIYSEGKAITLRDESLQIFIERYLDGSRNQYDFIPKEYFNLMAPISQQCKRAYNILNRLRKENDAAIPKDIAEIIGKLIEVTGMPAQTDIYNVTNYIKR